MEMFSTPEGFTLHRPLLLPDARAFSDVLEYLGEWDQFKDYESPSRFAGTPPAPRPLGRNLIGPFCTIDLGQLDGPPHRSIAVRATDATIDAVRGRIVTPDDKLSFRLIGHKGTNRVLVILEHGYIIGSHYLAYIDPATLPAYPWARRDERYKAICDAIKDDGHDPFVKRLAGGEIEVRVITDRGRAPDFHRTLDPNLRALIHADGSVTRTWADGTTTHEPTNGLP